MMLFSRLNSLKCHISGGVICPFKLNNDPGSKISQLQRSYVPLPGKSVFTTFEMVVHMGIIQVHNFVFLFIIWQAKHNHLTAFVVMLCVVMLFSVSSLYEAIN